MKDPLWQCRKPETSWCAGVINAPRCRVGTVCGALSAVLQRIVAGLSDDAASAVTARIGEQGGSEDFASNEAEIGGDCSGESSGRAGFVEIGVRPPPVSTVVKHQCRIICVLYPLALVVKRTWRYRPDPCFGSSSSSSSSFSLNLLLL